MYLPVLKNLKNLVYRLITAEILTDHNFSIFEAFREYPSIIEPKIESFVDDSIK